MLEAKEQDSKFFSRNNQDFSGKCILWRWTMALAMIPTRTTNVK